MSVARLEIGVECNPSCVGAAGQQVSSLQAMALDIMLGGWSRICCGCGSLILELG